MRSLMRMSLSLRRCTALFHSTGSPTRWSIDDRCSAIDGPALCAVFAGAPAYPALEGGGEDERVFVAGGVGDGFDLVLGLGEEPGGELHAEEDDVMHGGAP